MDSRSPALDAVFDEGVSTPGGWLDQALDNGYEIIPLEPAIVKKLEQMGYSRTVLPKNRYTQLKEDVLTIDYSGWSLVTRMAPSPRCAAISMSIFTRSSRRSRSGNSWPARNFPVACSSGTTTPSCRSTARCSVFDNTQWWC